MSRKELQDKSELSDRKSFVQNYIKPAMEEELIEYTIPEKPKQPFAKIQAYKKRKGVQEISVKNNLG